MLRHLTITALLIAVTVLPARAADDPGGKDAAPIAAAAALAARNARPALPSWAVAQPEKRPLTLTALYGTYGAIQVMDIVSTRRAIAAGAHEVNPLMGKGGTARLVAIKAATGASTIFFAERLWKKNKVGAIIVMAALNGGSAAIAARNQRHARR